MKASRNLRAEELSQSSHDGFLELSALATAGELSEEERRRLREHLVDCSSCREALRDYDVIASKAASAVGADSLPENLDPGPSWSLERAESSFLARLENENDRGAESVSSAEPCREGLDADSGPIALPWGEDAIWRHIWMQYAAGLILVIALSVTVYQLGMDRGTPAESVGSSSAAAGLAQLEQQLSDASYKRELLRAENEQRRQMIADLRRQLSRESAEITLLKESHARLERALRTEGASKDQLAKQHVRLMRQIDTAQAKAAGLQQKLDLLALQSSQDSQRALNLETQINGLTSQLREREETIGQQEELLAHDRDIRELMGARDLYIAEVYDVGRTGAQKKPCGRVFYTKGKSLIFYAYDLDRQSNLKNAKSSFQAWGRRGANWKEALNLGIFYEDNVAKKRWILRSNDPKALAHIDAVFVTVEPNGGSPRPSSKPFLFAYLKIEANHP